MAKASKIITAWINEGMAEGKLRSARTLLLVLIEERFPNLVPDAVRLAVEETNDVGVLADWHRKAIRARSMAELRRGMAPAG